MKSISMGKEIYFGTGALEQVNRLKGMCEAAFIVTDKTLLEIGLTKRLTDILDASDIKYKIYDDVGPDPTRSMVANAIKAVKEWGIDPDWIIGFGGGSPIDVAKAARVFLECPDIPWDKLIDPSDIPPLGKKKFMAISTTSGTGTEVSFGAVISNDEYDPPVKQSIVSPEIIPNIAIADPELAKGMPPKLTAATAFDALVHAIEAYTAKFASEFSRPLALQAAKMIFAELPNAYKDGSNMAAREALHTAQLLAGIAFTNSGLGIAHSMGHQLSSYYGASHGLACGLMLPYVIKFNAKVVANRYEEIAKYLDLSFKNTEDAVDKLIQALMELQKKVGIPSTIKQLPVSEEEFEKNIKDKVKNAIEDVGLMTVTPLPPTEEQFEEIYRKAYKGLI
jgi:alcohol dehydrogenase